jgi:integrase
MKGTVNKRSTRGGRARWEYCFDLGKDPATGKRRRITKSGFETKRDAENAMANALTEHRDRPPEKEEKPMPTFAEFHSRWHSEVVIRQHSPKTAERSYELAQYAIRLFGDAPLDQLSTLQLATAMNRLLDHGGRITRQHPQGRPLSSTTVRHIAFGLQACLEQAVDWEILIKNPMRKVRKPKRLKREPKVVDRNGFQRLLETAAGMRIYPVIVVAMATGMRRGEMCSLEWSDLDWDRATLSVSKSLEETKQGGLRVKSTKSGKPRRFAIPPKVVDVLRDHQREQNERRSLYGGDYHTSLNLIFARPDGYYYSPDKLGTRIKAALRKAGLGSLSLHSLRHSHASELLSQGVPITAISERLGHANAAITHGIYAHAMPADNQAAAMAWNNAMEDVLEASRREVLARKRGVTANDSAGSKKVRVIPIKSAS